MNTPIQASFSLFLYPFRLQSNWDVISSQLISASSIWQPSPVNIKDAFLLEHVHQFFQKNAALEAEKLSEADLNQGVLFELKDALSPTRAACSLEKIFTGSYFLKHKDESYAFSFHDGLKKNLLSPKLLLIPATQVGILSFSLSLNEPDNSLQQLIDFNYACRTLYQHTRPSAKITFQHEDISSNEQFYIQCIWGSSLEKTEDKLPQFFTLYQLVQFLLNDFSGDQISPITRKRFHIFTFLQTQKPLNQADLNKAVFHLSRVYNRNYLPPFQKMEDNPEAVQLFESIYMSASSEGGCILVNADADNISSFFQNYINQPVKNRYLWIYLLAFQQRITLINTAHKISALLSSDDQSVETVSQTIQILSRIQLRSMFSEISHFTMHNAFYTLCRNSFKIPELFQELKEELFDLNLIALQQYEHDRKKEEVDRRKREKSAEEKRRMAQERQSRFEGRINLILVGLGLLTFLSVWKDFGDIIQDGIKQKEWMSLVQLGILLGGLILLISILSRFSKSKKQ